MHRIPVALSALLAVLPLAAQESPPATPGGMPSPKQKAHDALQLLVGDWDVAMHSEAMPGIPGMEKAVDCPGTEHNESICDGLFLKSVSDFTWQGQPVQMVSVVGYDVNAKKYLWTTVSSDMESCGLSQMTGDYDAKTKTWTWSGDTPNGPMRSVFVHEDADHATETCYMVAAAGDKQCMQMKRTRSKSPRAKDASAEVPTNLDKQQKVLLADLGNWDATLSIAAGEGQTPMVEHATEAVRSICHGKWTWTDYNGSMMGAPFEGHALTGYDPASKQFVSFWIDTMESGVMRTAGTFDEAGKVARFTGTAAGEGGQPMAVDQTMTRKDDGSRVLLMKFGAGDQTMQMTITYVRQKAK